MKTTHIDMSNQIDNKWERDTILALVCSDKNFNCTIRLRNTDKSEIKKKYINPDKTVSAKRHNQKVINLIFAYLVFKLLYPKKVTINNVLICPDHRPSKEVHSYIQKISYRLGFPDLTKEINIDFINRRKLEIPKSILAHKLANKILKGKRKATLIADLEEIKELTSKIL